MHLSCEQSRHLAAVMEVLCDASNGLELRRHLGEPLLKLLGADFYASYDWNAEDSRYSDGVAINLGESHLKAYQESFQFSDPITPQLQRHRAPTLVTQVLPQASLVRSEFFCDFIGREGLFWGVNLFAFADTDHSSDLRVWRARHRSNFGQDELDVLRLIYPAFSSALRRTRLAGGGTGTTRAEPVLSDLDELQARLVRLAQLSQREAQVAARAAHGASDKEIARDLGIEFTTVRTHLAKSFRKLGVDGRNKLAHCLARWPLQ